MLQALNHPDAVLSLGAWAYVVLALAVFADSIVPLVPSELLCVAAGAFAATGRLNGWVVLPAVVAGGMLGDQATYHLGRAGSGRAVRTMTATPRRRAFFERLEGALSRRRTTTIVAARFLPGGRTGVGLLAGMTGQPRRGYAAASLLGVSAWAIYLVGAGYVAGHTVDSVWVSIGIALAVMTLVSTIAALRSRRARRRWPDPRTFRTSGQNVTAPAKSSRERPDDRGLDLSGWPERGWRQPARTPGG